MDPVWVGNSESLSAVDRAEMVEKGAGPILCVGLPWIAATLHSESNSLFLEPCRGESLLRRYGRCQQHARYALLDRCDQKAWSIPWYDDTVSSLHV